MKNLLKTIKIFTLIIFASATYAQDTQKKAKGHGGVVKGSVIVNSARCLFAMQAGGAILVCNTCTCGELSSAGVGYYGCIDLLSGIVSGNSNFGVKSFKQYSSDKVVAILPNNTEIPLAGDELQENFNIAYNTGNLDDLNGLIRREARSTPTYTGEINNNLLKKSKAWMVNN